MTMSPHTFIRMPAILGRLAIAAIALSIAAAPAWAATDTAKGEKIFAKCKICHEATAEKNKVGPYLKGVFGRKAGTVKGFTYSAAMKSAGFEWSEDKLKAFIADPKKLVPNNKMTFTGLKKQEEIENLIAYLKEATK